MRYSPFSKEHVYGYAGFKTVSQTTCFSIFAADIFPVHVSRRLLVDQMGERFKRVSSTGDLRPLAHWTVVSGVRELWYFRPFTERSPPAVTAR